MNRALIDDYVNTVTKGMGTRQREDVGKELRAHIMDSAEAIAAERKIAVDDVIIREVLARMGPAERIAAMYPAQKSIFMQHQVKALLSLAGIALAFLMVAAILTILSPNALHMQIPGSNGSSQDVLQIILSVVSALALAIVVIAAIFLCMYVYQSRLKTPYAARLVALDKSLKEAASPIRAVMTIVGTVIWLVLVNVFWSRVPFIPSFGDNASTLIPLLSDKFAPFLLYINIIGGVTIVMAVLYLAVAQKWIPAALEMLLNCANALLMAWILVVFPFNSALSPGVQLMIKLILAFIVFGCLIAAAKNLWETVRFALLGKLDGNGAV